MPNAIRVESMMNNLRVRTHTINKTTSFDGNGEMLLMRVYLTAGQRLRSVISWDACPDATVVDPAANGTHADLDLRIRRVGTGEVIRDAASYDGSYEITEFAAPTADHYDLVLQRFGWNACGALPVDTTYLGFAYDVR